MLAALAVAVWIALAGGPKPTASFADALKAVFGTSRYEITGSGINRADVDVRAITFVHRVAN
jgi:hypothetical protein